MASNGVARSTARRIAVSRRGFLTGAAATVAAARVAFPGGAFAQGSGPEVNAAKLGYIRLTDSAPLILAKELGLFAKHGMPGVEVVRQPSWDELRDDLALGGAVKDGIDGAHILRPMPLRMTNGSIMADKKAVPVYTVLSLNLNAQGISISNDYQHLKVGRDTAALRPLFAFRMMSDRDITAAMTFPGGTHDLWLRYWLAAGGIDPDKALKVVVVPPPEMLSRMKTGHMRVCSVGEPWNQRIVDDGVGYTAVMTGELWPSHPEKVLGMRADFVDKRPRATRAIMRAVMEAQQWADKPENKPKVAETIGKKEWLDVPAASIIGRITGNADYGNGRRIDGGKHFMKFWEGGEASYPFKSHDLFFLTENVRWGYLPPDTDLKALVDKVNREDLWKEAAKDLGVAAPKSTSRGKEAFFDGKVFDPADPLAYLRSQPIKRAGV